MLKSNFYFSEGPYLQALQRLHTALSSTEALIKLIGNARTGKSPLCEKLMLFMRHKGYRVVYFNFAIESPEMLRTLLARQLNLPTSANFSRMLEDIPLSNDGKPLILIFDDAHLLTDTTLLEIYRLIEIQSGSQRKLNVVLCGEPTLEQKLMRGGELRSLLLNISHTIYLQPMTNSDLAQFLTALLEKSGKPGINLQPAALAYFCKSSHGLPGPALILGELIVSARPDAAAAGDISKSELRQLVNEMQMSSGGRKLPGIRPRDSNRWMVSGPVMAVVVIASVGFLYQQLIRDDNDLSEPADILAASAMATESPFAPVGAAIPNEAVAATIQIPAIQVPAVGSIDSNERNEISESIDQPVPIASEPEAPVSDSDLVLVTAAERGVAAADIVEPVFEDVNEEDVSVEAAEVINTEVVAEVAVAIPEEIASADSGNQVVSDLTIAETESLPEPVQPEPSQIEPSQLDPVQLETAQVESDPLENETPIAVEPVAIAPVEIAPVEIDRIEIAPAANNIVATADIAEPESEAEAELVSSLDAVSSTVKTWIAAWQAQDLESYFGSYHAQFVPRYHPSIQRWQQDRQRVIGNARSITLAMSDYAVISSSSDRIEVQFWLAYKSPTYADSTLKKLVLGAQDGKWLILEEVNLQVRS